MNGVRGVSGARGMGRQQTLAIGRGGQFDVAAPAIAAEPVSVALAIGGLLSLQDEAAPARRDLAARRGGEAILQDLSRLQTALLGGHAPGALDALRETVARLPQAADPQLTEILVLIRLRASIELARHQSLMEN